MVRQEGEQGSCTRGSKLHEKHGESDSGRKRYGGKQDESCEETKTEHVSL